MERMPIWQIALRRIEMPVPRFFSLYVAPIVVATFLISIVLVYLTGGLAEGALFSGFTGVFLVIVLTGMSALAAMLFPVLEVQRSATLIEEEMHMFITRMGILSIGEVGAQSIFDILKQMRDYGELASEVKRIETLVDKWNTSLPEAARIVAHQSPSPLWSDFLDRMAFSIEAGQPIDEFMRSEQETIAEQYNTLYDTRLESVDTLKEIYVSLTTAGLFGLVIAGIHLVLFEVGGVNDTRLRSPAACGTSSSPPSCFCSFRSSPCLPFERPSPRTPPLLEMRWTPRSASIFDAPCCFRASFPSAWWCSPRSR